MPRRFNYTGRKRIRREHVSLRIIRTSSGITLDPAVRLGEYDFELSARVYLEAYRSASTQWKRFDLGRVGVMELPIDLSLDEFERPEGILFRVKVTSDGANGGKLLGDADALRPTLPEEANAARTPLIDPVPAALDGEVWRVHFGPDRPQLQINERIAGWKEVVRDPVFRSLVAPTVMRQVLAKILIVDRNDGDEDDPSDWRQNWIRFCEGLPGTSECPEIGNESAGDSERLELWIDDVVGRFGDHSGLFGRYMAHLDQGGAE